MPRRYFGVFTPAEMVAFAATALTIAGIVVFLAFEAASLAGLL